MLRDPAVLILMFFILPVWFAAGFADWLCHKATHIESTTGAKESAIHLLMFAEVAVPLLLALFCEINAAVIGIMIVTFFIHEATALWDVSYATSAREVTPIEQHVHSFLEMIPLAAILSVIPLHWSQFMALFGGEAELPEWSLRWKDEPLPTHYIACVLFFAFAFEFVPYLEELIRGFRASHGRFIPDRFQGRHSC